MSHPNNAKKYIIIDVDDDDDDDTQQNNPPISPRQDPPGASVARAITPPRLRDARSPDDAPSFHQSVVQQSPQQPILPEPKPPQRFSDGRLPNGQLITSKNTLQSFDHLVEHQQRPPAVPKPPIILPNPVVNRGGGNEDIDVAAPNVGADQHIIINDGNNNINDNNIVTTTVFAEAVAVTYADVEDLNPHPDLNTYPKRGKSVWLAILSSAFIAAIIASVAIGVGIFCGNGNCGNKEKTNTEPMINSTDITSAPLTKAPTASPITLSPISEEQQQLLVACNFLLFTNLTVCRARTEIYTAMGGTIPTELGLLSQLTYLNLCCQQRTGTIPSTLGSLTKLTWLGLFDNQLSGHVSSTLGNLVQINYMNLDFNNLNGPIPSTFENLVRLTHLSLRDNQLSGTVPSTLGNLTQLDLVDLAYNQLNGTIPSALGNLVQLTDLRLSVNRLTGTIPSLIGQMTQLASLLLFSNGQLVGTIPSTLCSIPGIRIEIDCANVVCTCCRDGMERIPCPSTGNVTSA